MESRAQENLKKRKITDSENINSLPSTPTNTSSWSSDDQANFSAELENLDELLWILKIAIHPEENRSSQFIGELNNNHLCFLYESFLSFLEHKSFINQKQTRAYIAFSNEKDFQDAKKITAIDGLGRIIENEATPYTIHEYGDEFFRHHIAIKFNDPINANILPREYVIERLQEHCNITPTSVEINYERKFATYYVESLEDWKKGFQYYRIFPSKNKPTNNLPLYHLYHISNTNCEKVFKLYAGIFPRTWRSDNLTQILLNGKAKGVLKAAMVLDPQGNSKRIAFIFVEGLQNYNYLIEDHPWQVNGKPFKISPAKQNKKK